LRETNADGRQLLIPATTEHGLKPSRGGLFIATNTHRLFFLFFGGAAFATIMPAKMSAPQNAPGLEMATVPRRRKTKSGGTIYVLPYKQATPPGFGMQAGNSEPYMSPAKMWVMTSASARCLSPAPRPINRFNGFPAFHLCSPVPFVTCRLTWGISISVPPVNYSGILDPGNRPSPYSE
jgi:hypothetical protein